MGARDINTFSRANRAVSTGARITEPAGHSVCPVEPVQRAITMRLRTMETIPILPNPDLDAEGET